MRIGFRIFARFDQQFGERCLRLTKPRIEPDCFLKRVTVSHLIAGSFICPCEPKLQAHVVRIESLRSNQTGTIVRLCAVIELQLVQTGNQQQAKGSSYAEESSR